MTADMAPREVTLREWSEMRGWALGAVRMWAKEDDFPARTRLVGRTGLYPLGELDKWKRGKPTYGLGRGGHRRKPS